MGEFAFKFLSYCVQNDFQILYSDLVVRELLKYVSKEKVDLIFENYGKQLVKVEENFEIAQKAKTLKKSIDVSFGDIIHALLAKGNDAILISRDKHFELLAHIVETGLPEDFI